MGFLANKFYYNKRLLNAPYVGFEVEKDEFLSKFMGLEKEVKFYPERVNGKKIDFDEQAIFNLEVFGWHAKTLDELLNLTCTYKTEYKIPNFLFLIRKEFKDLEKKVKFLNLRKKLNDKTEEEKKVSEKTDFHFLSITPQYYTYTKNFTYRKKTCVKSGGKVKVRTLCHLRNGTLNSFEQLTYYYNQIKRMLEMLFEFEPNMYGISKGVKDATKEILGTNLAAKLDLKDFFNSVTRQQIKDGFKFCKVELQEQVIDEIIEVGTPLGNCYQGQKLSTILCYIALLPVVKELNALDEHKKAFYIDDVFVSLNNLTFDEAVSKLKEYKKVFYKYNFKLNNEKCKILFGNKVFFLGVNLQTEQVGYNSYVKRLKAQLWNFHTKTNDVKNAQQCIGKLNYLKHINPEHYYKLKNHKKYGPIEQEALERISKGNEFPF